MDAKYLVVYDHYYDSFLKAFERRNSGFDSTAKNLGVAALILDLICVTWVLVIGVITIGIIAACVIADLCDQQE